ncbi:hypothetical protein pb186bvf_020827 [Paramecium bursaria]
MLFTKKNQRIIFLSNNGQHIYDQNKRRAFKCQQRDHIIPWLVYLGFFDSFVSFSNNYYSNHSIIQLYYFKKTLYYPYSLIHDNDLITQEDIFLGHCIKQVPHQDKVRIILNFPEVPDPLNNELAQQSAENGILMDQDFNSEYTSSYIPPKFEFFYLENNKQLYILPNFRELLTMILILHYFEKKKNISLIFYLQKNNGQQAEKNRRKQKQIKAFQPIPPLDNEKRNLLMIEAISANQLLPISKEQLQKLISRHLFDSWLIYIGYEAFIKCDKPTGSKFGRTILDRMNSDIIRPADDFHVIKEQYMHLWPPVKDDLKPQRDYLFICE